MPVNVFVNARLRVTAGLANDVEAVNQYAAVMYAATANGTAALRRRAHPQITAINPNVATNSLNIWDAPLRGRADSIRMGSPNIPCAAHTPINAPATCATTYPATSVHARPPWDASASVTAGLKCAPDTGPNVRISATRAAPVAIAFARSATATFPPARRSAMMPEPTTAARSIAVPVSSAARRRLRSTVFIAMRATPTCQSIQAPAHRAFPITRCDDSSLPESNRS